MKNSKSVITKNNEETTREGVDIDSYVSPSLYFYKEVNNMGLRRNHYHLRGIHRNKINDMRFDIELQCQTDGDIVTFHWIELEGATWNPVYETWEGGTKIEKTKEFKGIGKVVAHKEDEMEYEWGRLSVGQCLIRLPYDADVESLNDKQNLYFTYKGANWKMDNDLGVGDWHEGELISKILKGVKHHDKG